MIDVFRLVCVFYGRDRFLVFVSSFLNVLLSDFCRAALLLCSLCICYDNTSVFVGPPSRYWGVSCLLGNDSVFN